MSNAAESTSMASSANKELAGAMRSGWLVKTLTGKELRIPTKKNGQIV